MTATPPIRLLYIIDSLREAGAERSLVEMAPPLMERGVTLHVAYLGRDESLAPQLAGAGAHLHPTGIGQPRWRQLQALRSLLGRIRPDLVHTTLYEADVIGRSAARSRGVPYVTTFAAESYSHQHYANSSISSYRLRAAQLLDAVTVRGNRGLHAVSDSVADAMSARLRLPRSRLTVIPRGRARTRLGVASGHRRAQVRARLGIRDEQLIVCVARHEHEKGVDVVVDGFRRVLARHPAARLLVAGPEGRHTPRITQRAGAHLGREIILLGRRDDVADLMVAADIVVMGSRTEGLPGVVLEAMALECDIVATDIAGVRAALGDAPHRRLVAPDDGPALAHALDVALRQPLPLQDRVRLRERFEAEFSIDSVADRMMAFYGAALHR